MTFATRVRTAILEVFAETGIAPSPAGVAERLGSEVEPVLEAWDRLREGRAIVSGEDGVSIRMANPFSGIPTEHTFESAGVRYYANCAWDALGIPAALGRGGTVGSRCAHSGEPLRLEVADDGPEPCGWVFHSLVPAAHWWDDIGFT
ncbi:MAG: hypothetical protein F4Z74_09430 [Acidobacteria bacterium]|nr:hypothetical protein [Acidobacteriota bacterium]MYE45055.1 hypothetical protein [Acidobacteriota bacterium]